MHSLLRTLTVTVLACLTCACAPVAPAAPSTTLSPAIASPIATLTPVTPPTLVPTPSATPDLPAATAIPTPTASPSPSIPPTTTPPTAIPSATTLPATATTAPTAVPSPSTLPATAAPSALPLATPARSNVELAHDLLQQQSMQTTLTIVSSASTGVEGDIYHDMRARVFRSTTGPDEGIDTHSLACYPACVFVPSEEVNVLTVGVWMQVLRHEYRHIVQATHNSTLAADFRGPDGRFTSYAAFSEACADAGLNVAPVYQAQARLDQLRATLSATKQPLIDQACQGDKPSYTQVVQLYNTARGSDQAFALLFPPYQ